jgi:hypothetical protein
MDNEQVSFQLTDISVLIQNSLKRQNVRTAINNYLQQNAKQQNDAPQLSVITSNFHSGGDNKVKSCGNGQDNVLVAGYDKVGFDSSYALPVWCGNAEFNSSTGVGAPQLFCCSPSTYSGVNCGSNDFAFSYNNMVDNW